MYQYFAFVDESTAKRYRLCLVAIPSGDLKATRTELRKLRLKGQTRIHMVKESDRRRIQILRAIQRIDSWKCLILQKDVYKSDYAAARKTLFLVAAVLPIWKTIKHITIEKSNEMARDKQLLTWIKNNIHKDMEFDFLRPSEDECLWLADVLAWAYAKGGEYRKMISDRVELINSPN